MVELVLGVLVGLYVISAAYYLTICGVIGYSMRREPTADAWAMFWLFGRGFLESVAIAWLLWIRFNTSPQPPFPALPWLFFLAVNVTGVFIRFRFFYRFFWQRGNNGN